LARKQSPARSTAPARNGAERSDREIVEGIRRFVYPRLRNRADAEEVVQEVFTAVYRSIDAYSGRSSLAAWIYGIAKNTVNNHVRRAIAHEQRIERAEPELVRSAHSMDSCTPEERLNLHRCQQAIRQRLASVAEWQAQAFVMRHVDDLPIDEISRRGSRSNDAVRSSLYRVKKMLVETVDSGAATPGCQAGR
jgi:RNA polymerase sigma-70 factor (ECF subfamily)